MMIGAGVTFVIFSSYAWCKLRHKIARHERPPQPTKILEPAGHQQIYARDSSPMPQESLQIAKKSQRASVNIEAYIDTSIRSFPIRRNINELKNVRILG